jgi:mono/diheme cytochrome c family protein
MIRIVLNGFTGPVEVRGKTWNLVMPPWRENLTDAQVAMVLTYVRTELGANHASAITPRMVADARQDPHPALETSKELLRISE